MKHALVHDRTGWLAEN